MADTRLLFPTRYEANKWAYDHNLPCNVRAVYVEDVKQYALLAGCSRVTLPTLKAEEAKRNG